jgi:hypothetical protein
MKFNSIYSRQVALMRAWINAHPTRQFSVRELEQWGETVGLIPIEDSPEWERRLMKVIHKYPHDCMSWVD